MRSRRLIEVAYLGVLPVIWYLLVVRAAADRGVLAFDTHHAFWPAARSVLHGGSPYGPVTHTTIEAGTAFIYPPAGALALSPLGLLPRVVADVLMSLGAVAAMFGVLRVLGVRDWRCYAALSLWYPFYVSFQNANVSALLALGVALAWRYRERTVAAGVLVGALVAVKLFLWPLFVWLAFTRRRSAAVSVATCAGLSLAGVVVLGGPETQRFLDAASAADRVARGSTFSPYNLFAAAGAGSVVAHLLTYALGAALLVALVVVSRRADGERRALVAAVGAALVLSPVVWQHYFVLLAVPLALV